MKIYTRKELESFSLAMLRSICRSYGITGVSKTKKSDIISLLEVETELENDVDNTQDNNKIPYLNTHLYSYLDKGFYQSLVSVSCGASSSNYPVVGKSVGFVKALYDEILNIDPNAKSVVNGEESYDSYILKSGDVLEFVRVAGTKG